MGMTKPVVIHKKVVKNVEHYGKKHKTLHHSHSGHLKFDDHVEKPVVVHKKVVVNKPVVVKKKFVVEKPVVSHKKVVVEKPVVVKKKVVVEKPVVVHKKVVVKKPVVIDSYKGMPSSYDQPSQYDQPEYREHYDGNGVEVIDQIDDSQAEVDGEMEVVEEETDKDHLEKERDAQSYGAPRF